MCHFQDFIIFLFCILNNGGADYGGGGSYWGVQKVTFRLWMMACSFIMMVHWNYIIIKCAKAADDEETLLCLSWTDVHCPVLEGSVISHQG